MASVFGQQGSPIWYAALFDGTLNEAKGREFLNEIFGASAGQRVEIPSDRKGSRFWDSGRLSWLANRQTAPEIHFAGRLQRIDP